MTNGDKIIPKPHQKNPLVGFVTQRNYLFTLDFLFDATFGGVERIKTLRIEKT